MEPEKWLPPVIAAIVFLFSLYRPASRLKHDLEVLKMAEELGIAPEGARESISRRVAAHLLPNPWRPTLLMWANLGWGVIALGTAINVLMEGPAGAWDYVAITMNSLIGGFMAAAGLDAILGRRIAGYRGSRLGRVGAHLKMVGETTTTARLRHVDEMGRHHAAPPPSS